MTNPQEPTYEITFLRHGESTGNAGNYRQGQSEFPLTEKGQAQATALGAYWVSEGKKFDHLIASPQARARQTAEIIAGNLMMEIEFDRVWMERDNGVLAGLHQDEAKEKYPQPDFIHIYEPIGFTGESIWDLYLRGGQAIQGLLNRSPGRYLVVSHGGILNMTLQAILGITPQANFQGHRFRFRNTAYASLTYHPSNHSWVIDGINQRRHWNEE